MIQHWLFIFFTIKNLFTSFTRYIYVMICPHSGYKATRLGSALSSWDPPADRILSALVNIGPQDFKTGPAIRREHPL